MALNSHVLPDRSGPAQQDITEAGFLQQYGSQNPAGMSHLQLRSAAGGLASSSRSAACGGLR